MSTKKILSDLTQVKDEQLFWENNDPLQFTDSTEISDRFSNLKPSTKIITLRVPEHLLTNIKLIANKRDIPYQSLLKVFLQEKVNEELQTPFLKMKRSVVRKTAVGMLSVFLIGLLSYGYLVQPIKAVGSSMDPSYPTGTYYLLDKLAYTVSSPQRGEVVIFHSPSQTGSMYFKRVVGLPGEKIKIENDELYVNGEKLYEPYTKGKTIAKDFPKAGEELLVPGNSYYVLGDNREESLDSRNFGFVTKESITGKLSLCYWNCE